MTIRDSITKQLSRLADELANLRTKRMAEVAEEIAKAYRVTLEEAEADRAQWEERAVTYAMERDATKLELRKVRAEKAESALPQPAFKNAFDDAEYLPANAHVAPIHQLRNEYEALKTKLQESVDTVRHLTVCEDVLGRIRKASRCSDGEDIVDYVHKVTDNGAFFAGRFLAIERAVECPSGEDLVEHVAKLASWKARAEKAEARLKMADRLVDDLEAELSKEPMSLFNMIRRRYAEERAARAEVELNKVSP